MKKLMFATALVASAAAFADPTAINATSFEDYALGDMITNGIPEKVSVEEGSEIVGYFYFDAEEGVSNSSVVTNEGVSTLNHTAYFDGKTNAKYLALDTEGGTLWRSINTVGTSPNFGLGAAQQVGTGIYLDTLVQFTVTEDDAPETHDGDKLAIWLQAAEGVTNLMVRANYWEAAGEDPVATNFVATGVSIEPGTWYRLTVKAIPSVMAQGVYPAFQIFIDGTNEVAATTAQYSEAFQEVASSRWAEGMGALASANKLFPTLAEKPSALEDVTIQGVGFQGTGAVDEIVWTTDNPLPAPASANPTVDGVEVEPANVFNTAATDKSIVYPSAPTLAGTAGVDQTITFNGVTVNVPTYYTATLTGTTISLELNNNALPVIGEATIESEEKEAIEVGATTFTVTLTATNTKLYYGLKSATSLTAAAADWTVGDLTQGTGEAMQITMPKPTVSENPAASAFFKVFVTDVAPAAAGE